MDYFRNASLLDRGINVPAIAQAGTHLLNASALELRTGIDLLNDINWSLHIVKPLTSGWIMKE